MLAFTASFLSGRPAAVVSHSRLAGITGHGEKASRGAEEPPGQRFRALNDCSMMQQSSATVTEHALDDVLSGQKQW